MYPSEWIPVERQVPRNEQPVELMDSAGNVREGWRSGHLWYFRVPGTGNAIEYWRPRSESNRDH